MYLCHYKILTNSVLFAVNLECCKGVPYTVVLDDLIKDLPHMLTSSDEGVCLWIFTDKPKVLLQKLRDQDLPVMSIKSDRSTNCFDVGQKWAQVDAVLHAVSFVKDEDADSDKA